MVERERVAVRDGVGDTWRLGDQESVGLGLGGLGVVVRVERETEQEALPLTVRREGLRVDSVGVGEGVGVRMAEKLRLALLLDDPEAVLEGLAVDWVRLKDGLAEAPDQVRDHAAVRDSDGDGLTRAVRVTLEGVSEREAREGVAVRVVQVLVKEDWEGEGLSVWDSVGV